MKMREEIEMLKLREMPTSEQAELRARSVVAQLLIKKLIVPKIFFEARWTARATPDILAIDRSGTGDVHVVEIKTGILGAKVVIPALLETPANFRWLAILLKRGERLPRAFRDSLAPQHGAGRIGVIRITSDRNDLLSTQVEVSAERFPGSLYEKADRFNDKKKADIEFR